MVVCAALYDWLLVLHILASMVWFGGVAVLNVQALLVVRRSDPAEVERFVGSLRSIGPVLLAPSTIALVVLGISMVIDAEAGTPSGPGCGRDRDLPRGVRRSARPFRPAALGRSVPSTPGERATEVAQLMKWMWGMRVILVLLVVTWGVVFKPGI